MTSFFKGLVIIGILAIGVFLFFFFSIAIFPPAGQGCIAMVGADCDFHKETAFEYFILNRGTIGDLWLNHQYNAKLAKDTEEMRKQAELFKAQQPVLTLDQIKIKLENAKKENIQNQTIGKYNGFLIVIQRYSEPPVWNAFYERGSEIAKEKCSTIGYPILNGPNGRYLGCSPVVPNVQ